LAANLEKHQFNFIFNEKVVHLQDGAVVGVESALVCQCRKTFISPSFLLRQNKLTLLPTTDELLQRNLTHNIAFISILWP
jgi:hypothetical protein